MSFKAKDLHYGESILQLSSSVSVLMISRQVTAGILAAAQGRVDER
jgi:hypothetical protein